MTNYQRGADFERRVAASLTGDGYHVVRSAGSRAIADLVAVKRGEVLLVQCKRDGEISLADWNELLDLATKVAAVPLLALMPGRRGIAFRRLLRRAEPHKRRIAEPWSADHGWATT